MCPPGQRMRWRGSKVKATFDVALARSREGCQDCLGWTEEHLAPRISPCLVMEATGGDNTLARSYRHLLQEGKPPMVPLVVSMRKIHVLCRAVLGSEQDYDPSHVKPTRPVEI